MDKAIQRIEERIGLKFDRTPTISHIGYRVYDLLDSSRKIRLIAEVCPILKWLQSWLQTSSSLSYPSLWD